MWNVVWVVGAVGGKRGWPAWLRTPHGMRASVSAWSHMPLAH
jgi:hypothetical protein